MQVKIWVNHNGPNWSKRSVTHFGPSMENQTGRLIKMSYFYLMSSKAATNTKLTLAHDQLLLKLIPFSTLFPGALLLYIKTSNQRNSWQKRQTNCRQVSSNFSSNLSWKSICPHLTEMLHYGETGYEVFQQIYITFDHLSQQCFFQKFIFVIFQA